MIPKIVVTKGKVLVHYRCPRCKKFHYKAIPIIQTRCDNCHAFFETQADIDIFSTIAKPIWTILGREDDVDLVAKRDPRTILSSDDTFNPSSKLDFQIYSALIAVRDTLERNRNYDFSKVELTMGDEWFVKCKRCGKCNTCVTCLECEEHYVPKHVNGSKFYQCPECKSKNYKPTELNEDKLIKCTHCSSENISYTDIDVQCKHCTKCKAPTPKPKKIPIYKLRISHQERFRKNGQ